MKYLKSSFVISICFLGLQVRAQQKVTFDTLENNVLDEVVVTGQFEPQSMKNSVYKVRTISSEEIRLRASTTVENILNTQLGMRFSND